MLVRFSSLSCMEIQQFAFMQTSLSTCAGFSGAAFVLPKLIKRVSHDVRCPGRCKTICLNSSGRLRLAWQWLLADSSGCTQGVKEVVFSSSDILRCTDTRLHSDPSPPRRP